MEHPMDAFGQAPIHENEYWRRAVARLKELEATKPSIAQAEAEVDSAKAVAAEIANRRSNKEWMEYYRSGHAEAAELDRAEERVREAQSALREAVSALREWQDSVGERVRRLHRYIDGEGSISDKEDREAIGLPIYS